MSDDSRPIFEAYIKESMPYPEFAKLSKHASSKLPKETAIEEPSRTSIARPTTSQRASRAYFNR